jgi:hypothetical protein
MVAGQLLVTAAGCHVLTAHDARVVCALQLVIRSIWKPAHGAVAVSLRSITECISSQVIRSCAARPERLAYENACAPLIHVGSDAAVAQEVGDPVSEVAERPVQVPHLRRHPLALLL